MVCNALAVVTVYVLAACLLTWPLAVSLTSHLGALQGPGDPYLNLWILGWGLKAWTTDPASVFSGRVFDANIFFPAEGTLAYSDHFLLQALAMAPVYAVSQNVVLCYNLLLIGSLALSGIAMHAFAKAVTGSTAAAFVAGLAWACWPYRTAHLLHIQLQALYLMPLALLCVHRVSAKRRWRDAIALAAAIALQAIASIYYGVMTAVVVVVSALALAVSTGQWRARRLWLVLTAAAVLTFVLMAPVLVPYSRSQHDEGFGRTLYEAANHAASWQSYAQVPPVNLLYGRSGLLEPRETRAGARDRTGVEHQLFPGFVVIVLAFVGLVHHLRSDSRPLVMTGLALIVMGVALSFGPEGLRPLYALLHDNLYGFQAIRAPARFAVIAMLGVALLAGLGIRALVGSAKAEPHFRTDRGQHRLWGPALAGPVLISLLCLEYLNAPLPLVAAPPRQTAVGQWLAREPTPGAVLHVPLTIDLENTPYMVQSLEHGRAIVNGYSGQRPAYFSSIVDSLADFPSPTAFAVLRELDVRFVVSAAPVAGAGSDASPLIERARLEEAAVYEVKWTPSAIAALDDVNAPPPPPPGSPPFTAGEVAQYSVHWDGGPVDLPAGAAVLRVTRGEAGSDRWQFEAHAETASWVSSFFQARDRFVTTTDAGFHPLEHSRDIREGRRELRRTYVYDRRARHVRIGESPEAALASSALTLPFESEAARDALSALYYVRTVPLTSGTIITVPLNEAGTNMVLQVSTGEIETIEHHGQSTRALRLEPRLMRRLERRRPLAMTIWLSDDARRVPLRAIVEAGFGKVRLELVEYSR